MPRLSLRLRLSLALLAIVSLLGVVAITSYLAHRDIQSEVAVLYARHRVDLGEVDLERNGLELEGTWDPAGIFIADEVEVFPGKRRPKLRGTIQGFDLTRNEMTLYGQTIAVSPALVREHGSKLRTGQRVEVTCDAKDGVWRARKLDFADVKESDKIKACATSWEIDGVAPESLEIHGIAVSLVPKSEHDVKSALHDVETATSLLLCLHELRSQAARLTSVNADALSRTDPTDLERDARVVSEPRADLRNARDEFEHYLTRTQTDSTSDSALDPRRPNRFAAGLFELLPVLDQKLERLLAASEAGPVVAAAELRTGLEPFLAGELEPRIDVYLREAQDDLGDRARSLESSTRTTAQVGLGVGIFATLVALVLGFLLWRSIQRPLVALETAAKRIGEGDLGARVQIETRDEFGALASAFNHMTETLARTTVSIDNMQNILDSMAGALILLTPERRIKSVNHAAARLLLSEPNDLIGKPLAMLCGESCATDLLTPSQPGQEVVERSLLRKDNTAVAVSFSAAELRSSEGLLNGYVCIAQDLSDQKRIENQVRTSLQEKELLLREVHHRVKNNMQVISSLLAMQQSCAEDPTVAAGLEQSQDRIRSMALIHEHLYQSADLAQADVSAYLNLLISHISHSCGDSDLIELKVHIESLDLDLDQSLALGLIVNELLANSYRHAFEGRSRGQIRLSLRLIGNGLAELLVEDDGRGMDVESANRSTNTLGLSLVRTLVEQLGGTTEVAADVGVTTRITFPCRQLQKVAS